MEIKEDMNKDWEITTIKCPKCGYKKCLKEVSYPTGRDFLLCKKCGFEKSWIGNEMVMDDVRTSLYNSWLLNKDGTVFSTILSKEILAWLLENPRTFWETLPETVKVKVLTISYKKNEKWTKKKIRRI